MVSDEGKRLGGYSGDGIFSDTYSHRLDSYDILSFQYALVCEELVRKNLGKINSKTILLEVKDKDSLFKNIDELVEKVSSACDAKIVKDEGDCNWYFLSDNWAGLFKVSFQTEYIGEADEPFIRGVRDMSLDLCASDNKIFDKVVKICVESGFEVIGKFDARKGVPVTFVFPGPRGPEYHTQSFEKLKLEDIRNNYEDSVIETTNNFLDRANSVTHGILLISGPVGTGKSYLIRSLLTELLDRRALVCTPPTEFLVQAGLLAQVVANFKKSIVILEDIGDLVELDAAARHIDARANLLNFTEGFLSLLTDTIVVISFNHSLDKIDPAILRPGRCIGNIEIKDLSYNRASELVSFEIPDRSYSLAEVYEMRRSGNLVEVKKTGRAGFLK